MNDEVEMYEDAEDYRQDLLDGSYLGYINLEEFQPGTFGHHELVDRLANFNNMFDQLILEHPACFNNEEVFAEGFKISTAIAAIYQKVATAKRTINEPSSGTTTPR